MKSYTSLKEARRSLIIQVLSLALLIGLIMVIARSMAKNDFYTSLILSNEEESWKTSDLQIRWKDEEIPMNPPSIEVAEDGISRATVMNFRMKPEKPGDYEFAVIDPAGKEVASDTIHVDMMNVALSEHTGNFTDDEGILLAAGMFYLGLSIIMLIFFFRLKGPLLYSYYAILAFGIFIFSLVTILLETPVYIRHLQTPAFYPTWELLSDIASGGQYFVTITSPLILVFSILLIISNIALLRHERPRVQNILGLLLGLIMIAVEAFFFLHYVNLTMASAKEYRIITTVENIIGIILTYAECILISSVVCGLRAAKHKPKPDRDYILILGCGFRKDGTLPPLLRGRVDKAMEFWHEQKKATGKEAIIIPSGGQGGDEPMPEAEAMYRYMLSTGFPEKAIIQENKSANTYQNMDFSKQIIMKNCGDISNANTAFVTTNYHVFRSGVWAGLAGLPAEGIGSKTKWWFWPNAFVRECIGLLKNRIVTEIIFLVILIAVFGFFTYLTFL